MTDERRNVDTPVTPGIFRAPSEEPNAESVPHEYVMQLESRLQEVLERVHELEQRPEHPVPVVSEVADQNVPSGYAVPQYMSAAMGSMPPPTHQSFQTPPPYGYPYQTTGMYPYPYQMFPPPPVEVKKKCTFKHFLDCKPPEFRGSMDPTVTLDWLREVDRALDACECEPELRVTYAGRLLKGKAMVWWDSLIAHIPKEQVKQITWEQFYQKVCEQYCTSFEIGRLKREFMGMQMTRDMTVDEVIEQFNDKLRFVQQWVPDEQSRIQHFVDILLPEYRVMARTATTLSQAFVMAKIAEGDIKDMGREGKEKTVQPSKQTSSKASYNSKRPFVYDQMGQSTRSGSVVSSRSWCNRCRSSHDGPCSVMTRKCWKCGVMGHEAQACTFRNSVCWNCHQEGHRIAQCPVDRRGFVRTGSGVGAVPAGGSSGSVTGQKRKTVEARAYQMIAEEDAPVRNVAGMFCYKFSMKLNK